MFMDYLEVWLTESGPGNLAVAERYLSDRRATRF